MTYRQLIELLQRMIPDQLDKQVILSIDDQLFVDITANVITRDNEVETPYIELEGEKFVC